MVSWVRGLHFLTHGRAVWEDGGSNPGYGTIVGGIFHPIGRLAKFSQPNMPSIVNLQFIYN